MPDRFETILAFLQRALIGRLRRLGAAAARAASMAGASAWRRRARLVSTALLSAGACLVYLHPPPATVHRSEVLVRTNEFDGSSRAYSAGTVLLVPGMHQLPRYPTRDQLYRPAESARASGPAPFQSSEGLSIGVDLTVRWAIDRARIAQMSREYPDDLNTDLVRPAVQGVVYPLFARHSVREIFSSQRALIQQEIATELKPKLAARAQEETMKHILPFKQKQIEQRQLEAQAEKLARIRTAEGAAEARRIETKGEADSRQKLADAEAYRVDLVGKANAGQMEREGALIAPTPTPGEFIGANLVGVPGAAGRAATALSAELRLDDLALVRQASTPERLADFGRWQDVAWRRDTFALH